jgi:hypothetical protein
VTREAEEDWSSSVGLIMDKADQIASAYIVSLWGARRRAFARLFWLHLTRNRPCPDEDCFGAQRIKRQLDRIWRETGQHWWHDWT